MPSTYLVQLRRSSSRLGPHWSSGPRQVRLTETGAWYRSEVSGSLRAIAAANEGAQEDASEPVGTVRLTALPGYGEIRLFAVLELFQPSILRSSRSSLIDTSTSPPARWTWRCARLPIRRTT